MWEILDEEYGDNIDICPEVIGELTSFKFSTRSPTQQFLEFYNKYSHAKQDLKQVNKLSELDNLTTLRMLAKKLPGEHLKWKYAEARVGQRNQSGTTELDIFDRFMTEQYKVEKEKSNLWGVDVAWNCDMAESTSDEESIVETEDSLEYE